MTYVCTIIFLIYSYRILITSYFYKKKITNIHIQDCPYMA